MKKTVSISFLLLANIVLLAHSIIPHHHHAGIAVSFFKIHYAEEVHEHKDLDLSHDHDSNHGEAPHQHEDNYGSEVCILNSTYARIENSDQQKLSNSYDSDYDNDHNAELSAILPPRFSFAHIQNTGLPFRQKPFTVTYQTCISFNCVGLRAPPVC